MVFVGRLTWQKGLDVLFDALAQLRELHEWQLDILGEGPDTTELMARSQRLGLARRVHFHGACSPAEVQANLLRAHLFVLPSRYEGLSNAALEALSLGLPCVLTRCGGIDTYIDQDSGWVCSSGDPAELADAIRQGLTLDRHAWIERSHRSLELVRRHFDLDSCARRHIELFENLIAGD